MTYEMQGGIDYVLNVGRVKGDRAALEREMRKAIKQAISQAAKVGEAHVGFNIKLMST